MKCNHQNRILISLACMLFAGNCLAQCDVQAVPNMWVPQIESQNRTTEFLSSARGPSKFEELRRINSNEVSYNYFTLKTFQSLLEKIGRENVSYSHLRVYIVSFNQSTAIDRRKRGTLMLIFAPAIAADPKSIPINTGKYYYINEMDQSVHVIRNSVTLWRNYHNQRKMPALNKTIQAYDRDCDNYFPRCPEAGHIFSDTKSIYYCREDINVNFKNEIDYQLCRYGIHIDGIRVNFASYTDQGRLLRNGTYDGRFRNRFHILFEYTIGGEANIYYIDSRSDFKDRPLVKPAENCAWEEHLELKSSSDNGQLCPPNCPPPPTEDPLIRRD